MQWQAPRPASLSEIKAAYKAKAPISQDFRFANASVYFAAFPDLNLIKIGVSNNVPQRLLGLSKRAKCAGYVLLEIPGNRREEAAQHRRFAPFRVKGEWFVDCPEVRALIAATRASTSAS